MWYILVQNLTHFYPQSQSFWSKILYIFGENYIHFGPKSYILVKYQHFVHFGQKSYILVKYQTFCLKISYLVHLYILVKNLIHFAPKSHTFWTKISKTRVTDGRPVTWKLPPIKMNTLKKNVPGARSPGAHAKVALKSDFISHVKPF